MATGKMILVLKNQLKKAGMYIGMISEKTIVITIHKQECYSSAMTKDQQRVLCANTARNMGDSTLQIKHRHINNCYQADQTMVKG